MKTGLIVEDVLGKLLKIKKKLNLKKKKKEEEEEEEQQQQQKKREAKSARCLSHDQLSRLHSQRIEREMLLSQLPCGHPDKNRLLTLSPPCLPRCHSG